MTSLLFVVGPILHTLIIHNQNVAFCSSYCYTRLLKSYTIVSTHRRRHGQVKLDSSTIHRIRIR